jgi:hypothetical protein
MQTKQVNANQMPFPLKEGFTANELNELFTLLFSQKANKQTYIFDNAAKADIAPSFENISEKPITNSSEVFVNKKSDGVYIGVRIEGDVYQIKLTKL